MARIQLLGEVKYPGTYPILEERSTLYSVVKQAGLFTDKADLSKARIIRWSVANQHDPEYSSLKLFDAQNMDQTEISYLKMKNRYDPPTLTVDFVKLFNDNDMKHDVLLCDGDQIEIPYKTQTVNVVGFVKHPGIVTFKAGESYRYYIELAGGFAYRARTGSVRLIKGNSGKWEKVSRSTVIEVGDTIFIPEKDEFDGWIFFKDVLLVASQVTTIILVVKNLAQ
jgi:protein involved in polysaccharide export with SLBB domain